MTRGTATRSPTAPAEMDHALLARAGQWPENRDLHECDAAALMELARREGLDFATAVLYDRVLRQPDNRAFHECLSATDGIYSPKSTTVGIVPGAFYRNHNHTGANGAQLAEIATSLGSCVERIPIDSFGSLTRNAALIAEWLETHRKERVVLMSLSKGSADLKTALCLRNAGGLFRNVRAWVSVSGLPFGTPLIAWLRRQPMRSLGVRLLLAFRGQRYSVLEELRHEEDGPLAGWPDIPSHLRTIHVVAFPLRRHLAHPWAPRAYERLAPLGPNDGGGFLLGDVAKLPGTVVPIWGADHYLQPLWNDAQVFKRILTRALSAQSVG